MSTQRPAAQVQTHQERGWSPPVAAGTCSPVSSSVGRRSVTVTTLTEFIICLSSQNSSEMFCLHVHHIAC